MYKSLCSILTVESADREMYRIRDKSDGIAVAATDNIVKFLNLVELSGPYVDYCMTEGPDRSSNFVASFAELLVNVERTIVVECNGLLTSVQIQQLLCVYK
jgi:hypothetical protein